MYLGAHDVNTLIPGPREPSRSKHEGVDAMGRGRAKAKQTKVARELKYYSPSTDLTALQRELHAPSRFDDLVNGRAVDTDEDEDQRSATSEG